MTEHLIAVLREARIVPVIRHRGLRIAETACRFPAEAGARGPEITMTVPEANGLLRRHGPACPDVTFAAGTVLDTAQAQGAIASGAQFVVSPCWCEEVVAACRTTGVPYLSGAVMPGGPGFLKVLRSVFAEIPLMPTGGVTVVNVADYLVTLPQGQSAPAWAAIRCRPLHSNGAMKPLREASSASPCKVCVDGG